MHNVFHVLMLRKYKHDPSHVLSWSGLKVEDDATLEVKPVEIRKQVLR